jgi:hypothetical protein
VFAVFNLGAQEIIVLAMCFGFLFVPAVVLAIVLPLTLRRRRPAEPEDGATPLERARDAAAVLTPEERAALRRSLEERLPPPAGGGEGITS